jgi:hypothetical protein
MHRGEGDVVPRDLVPGEERDFEAFGAGRDRIVDEAGAVDQLDLADPRDVVDRQEPLDLDLCLSLSSQASRSAPALADSLSSR